MLPAHRYGEHCHLLSAAEARRRCPGFRAPQLEAVLESTVELRIESRTADSSADRVAGGSQGRDIHVESRVLDIDVPVVRTSWVPSRPIESPFVPGTTSTDCLRSASRGCTDTVQTADAASLVPRLHATGSAECPILVSRVSRVRGARGGGPLKARLLAEQPEHLEQGIHLIVVQSADGTWSSVTATTTHRPRIRSVLQRSMRSFLKNSAPPWIGTAARA